MTKACPLPHNSCLGDHRNLPPPDIYRRLPAELLASVFIHIARDSYIDKKYSYNTPTAPGWVNASHVCRYWRDVALNCPTLWSYIPATSQRWIHELLARSQMAPLKISTKVTTGPYISRQGLTRAEVLSIVEHVVNHSQRIQMLHCDIISVEASYQILSKFLSTHAPSLQHLEISYLYIPWGKSCLLLEENTPALRTLRLKHCSVPWHSLGPSVLTTLHLSSDRMLIFENTIAEFLAMLRRMPDLVHLSVENSLPNARDFLSNGTINTIPTISLPRLSSMSIIMAPFSAVIALLSCVDIPLRTKIQMQVKLEYARADDQFSSLNGCVRLGSLLAQRIGRSKLRSLTIGSTSQIALAFSTSERVESHSPDSLFSIRSDVNALLKVNLVAAGTPIHKLDHFVMDSVCNAIPLTNIQSVHFLGLSPWPNFWRKMLASLSDVRHIRFSRDRMPNIASMLSLPSLPLMGHWQDGRTDTDQGEIFVPALEELELYQTTLRKACGRNIRDPYAAHVQELYDAISTRKETRCRLTIKDCRLSTVEAVETLDSVGSWEGAEFRVTSNVRHVCQKNEI